MSEQTVNVDVSNALKNLLPNIRRELKDNQKNTEKAQKKSSTSKSDSGASAGFSTGGQAGSQVEKDLNELRSGRFAGVFEGRAESLKKLKDSYKKAFSKDSRTGSTSPEGSPQESGAGLGIGKELKELKVRDLKVDKLIGGGSGQFGGGVSTGVGGPGGGGGKPSVSGDVGSEASKWTILGVSVGAVAGLALKLGSSLAGMYQGVMQEQERTLDATGGYMGGGGNLVRNSELASITVARAQMQGGSASDYGMSNFYTHRGIQFGQSQGIGAGQGAELFAKLQKYGGLGDDPNELKKIFADGVEAGFNGLKMGTFVREIASVTENAYKSGMGIQSGADVANSFSGLSGMGVRDERLGSVYNNLNSGITTSGNILNSMALAGHLGSGKGILESKMLAEQGMGSQANRSNIMSMLSGMDPELQGLFLAQNGFMTNTEAYGMSQSGKSPFGQSVPTNMSKGQDTLNRMDSAGQSFRGKENEINETIAFSPTAKGAYEIQNDITKALLDTYKAVEKLGMGITQIVNKMDRK